MGHVEPHYAVKRNRARRVMCALINRRPIRSETAMHIDLPAGASYRFALSGATGANIDIAVLYFLSKS